jgi:DNA-binding GntR family transcriptional regulator
MESLSHPTADAVLDALDEVIWELPEIMDRLERALRQAEVVRSSRLEGKPYRDILEQTGRPLIVELLTTNLNTIERVEHQLRTTEAQALHAEGLTTDRIAELFGVSRQRLSALLRLATPRSG